MVKTINKPHKLRILLFAFLTAITLMAGAVPSVLAQDQSEVSFKNALLSVDPEYDSPPSGLPNPSMLVMFEGTLVAPNLSSPIYFLVPSGAVLYSAGSGPRDQYVKGGSLNQTASNLTGWDQVSFIPQTNYFILEYYIPIGGVPDRSIPYEFHTVYPISGLRILIQEPRRATNFAVTPEGTASADSEGFKVHVYNVPTVTPDQPLLYNITYSKPDTNPSLGGGTGGTSSNTTLIIVVVGVIIILGAALFLLPRRSSGYESRSRRRQAERTALKKQTSSAGKGKFCRSCGKPVQPGDKFCPFCGESI